MRLWLHTNCCPLTTNLWETSAFVPQNKIYTHKRFFFICVNLSVAWFSIMAPIRLFDMDQGHSLTFSYGPHVRKSDLFMVSLTLLFSFWFYWYSSSLWLTESVSWQCLQTASVLSIPHHRGWDMSWAEAAGQPHPAWNHHHSGWPLQPCGTHHQHSVTNGNSWSEWCNHCLTIGYHQRGMPQLWHAAWGAEAVLWEYYTQDKHLYCVWLEEWWPGHWPVQVGMKYL